MCVPAWYVLAHNEDARDRWMVAGRVQEEGEEVRRGPAVREPRLLLSESRPRPL